ncbi:MAG: hypothetical protein ACYTDT_12875 [Planctomycetota bacterium]
MILYFGDRLLTDQWLKDVDLAALDGKGLVACVRVKEPKKEVVEEAPEGDVVSPVPGNKLTAANLWTEFGVKKTDTIVICDQWGNEYRRVKGQQKLEALVIKMTRDNRKLAKKLQGYSLKAKAALGKSDLKTASKELLKVFKAKKFGWEQTETAATLYQELLDKGREQIEAAGNDVDKLESIKKTVKGTELADEIAKKLEGVN